MHTGRYYYFSPHVYCCAFSDGAIFLNARTGDYLGVDGQYLPALTATIADWPTASSLSTTGLTQKVEESARLITDLHKRGILTTTASFRPSLQLADPVQSSAAIGRARTSNKIPMRHRIAFIAALLRVLVMRRKDRLEPIINWLQRRQAAIAGCGSADPEEISSLLSSFERMRVWFYTANKKCLFDSLVLSTFLSLTRRSCTFVIAVSTKPFLAHSWVQVEKIVLNDTVEHVQLFRPIMIVR